MQRVAVDTALREHRTMSSGIASGDWYWDIDRQIAVRADNRGRHDVTIGPYPTKHDAEIWMPSRSWTARPDDGDDTWVDVNSAYD
ncbi:MAG: hypothetical protein ACE37B_01920 [Ilumatobacter sp.]|uniref:hypothetical protein n=1 Tax=Ilumatobacter sp. TaxID=1967498 RepID=UPI00391CA366